MLEKRNVIAGHLCVTDQEARRCKACKAGAYYVGRFLIDAFRLFRCGKCLVVTAAVIHYDSS